MRHIPNILTFVRFILVGVFCVLFSAGRYTAALSVYIFAFATDVLDGGIARRYNWISNLGKLLDPLADKLMTVAALLCILLGKRQPVYAVLFALAAFKELLMLLGGFIMMRRRVVAFADWFGKLATGLYVLGIMLTLLSFSDKGVEPWNIAVLIAATVFSYVALVHYATSQFPRAFRANREDAARADADGGTVEPPRQ